MRHAFQLQDKCGFRAGDANLYRYVGNNPTNMTDPSSLQKADTTILKPKPPWQGEFTGGEIVVTGRVLPPSTSRWVVRGDVTLNYPNRPGPPLWVESQRPDGFQFLYNGPGADRIDFLQFAWQEVIIKYMDGTEERM